MDYSTVVVDGPILHSRSRLQFAVEPGGEAEFRKAFFLADHVVLHFSRNSR